MSVLKRVIVAGGGSNLGPHILSALHSSAQNFQISALHRPSSTTKFPSYVTPISTDFTPSSLTAAFQDQDVVISVLGFDGLVEQNKMIDAAKEAGVKRFIPSEFGWSKDLPMVPELKARLKIKEDGFKYLIQKCEDGGMTWSALASGIFIDWCLQKVPTMGFSIPKRTARIHDSGNEPFTCTTGSAVGTAVANILSHPSETANRYLKTASFKTTQNEMLNAFEDITAEKWDVTRVTTKQVLEERGELIKQKRFPEVFMGVVAIQLFEDGAGRGVTIEVEDSDNELLGVKVEDVRDVLKMFV